MTYRYPAALTIKLHVLALPIYAMLMGAVFSIREQPVFAVFFSIVIVAVLGLVQSVISRPVIEIKDGVVFYYPRLAFKGYPLELGPVNDIRLVVNKKDMYLRVAGRQDAIIDNHYLKQSSWRSLISKLQAQGINIA